MKWQRAEGGARNAERRPQASMRRRPGAAVGGLACLRRSRSGFALVITLVLLALLVLAVYALSVISRVGAEAAATGNCQLQARQHALLGLSQALGALHRAAAADDRLTAMAGLAGVLAGSNRPTRHWAGVWSQDGALIGWLASGSDGVVSPTLASADAVALVAGGSLASDGTDREHVKALRVAVVVPTRERGASQLGGYAWLALDEGVKLSAVLPDERHAIDALVSLSPDAPLLANVLSYEQIAQVPASVTPTALAGQLRQHFHALGRVHLGLSGTAAMPGRLNVNTTSHPYWRGVAATYNRLKPASSSVLSPARFADRMSARVPEADPDIGKALNAPYRSVEQFLGSAALAEAVAAGGGELADFAETLGPWLTVRSDTFRIRAYGDAVNAADAARLEATAWCEAIVQRVKDDPGASSGRFVIRYFRWLGPDDI